MSGLRDTLDDNVVGELDVFLSQPDEDCSLHVLQYPLRSTDIGIGKERRITAVKVRPEHGRIEVNLAVLPNHSDPEEITSADGCSKSFDNAQELVEEKDIGHNQCLRSGTQLAAPVTNFAIGKYCTSEQSSNGRPSFTMVPVQAISQLRPAFDYLDTFDMRQLRSRLENKVLQANARGEVDKSSLEKSGVSQLQVSFRKRETDRAVQRRKNSYAVFQEKEESEPWLDVDFIPEDNAQVRLRREKLFEQVQSGTSIVKDEMMFEEETQYTDMYQAHTHHVRQGLTPKSSSNSDPLSVRALQQLPIDSAIAQILGHARIVTFADLVRLVRPHTSREEILTSVKTVGICLRGCWIAKKGQRVAIGRQKVPVERYDASRLIVLDLFRRSRIISMKEAVEALGDEIIISYKSIETILKEVSDRKKSVGWELKLEDDQHFMHEYAGEVRQQINLWDQRVEEARAYLIKSVHPKRR